MATTTYEEERKRPEIKKPQTYDYAAPQGTYYGEPGRADSDMAEEILRRAAEQADPQRQAEEDARIQRGRNFWTGANLFANVVANAINVNGTAKGAPNMTWNDAASQKMYDTWRTADQQLKADRKAAQQRFDALQMQDAQMRAAGSERRAAEAKAAFDINFQNEQAYRKAQDEAAQRDFEYKRKKADEEAARQQAKQDRIDFYDYQRRHPMPSRNGGSGLKDSGDHSVSLGSVDIPAKDKKEAEKMRKDIANKIVERHNAGVEARNAEKKNNNRFIDEKELEKPIDKPKNDKESEAIIYQLGGMYDDDDDFRKDINETYGIDDIYSEDVETPEFEKFAGHSVRPDESSLPNPRMYAGSTPQNPRAYRGKPVTWNTSLIKQTPHALSEGEKELISRGGKKPKIDY